MENDGERKMANDGQFKGLMDDGRWIMDDGRRILHAAV
jgi:hypothetical protein